MHSVAGNDRVSLSIQLTVHLTGVQRPVTVKALIKAAAIVVSELYVRRWPEQQERRAKGAVFLVRDPVVHVKCAVNQYPMHRDDNHRDCPSHEADVNRMAPLIARGTRVFMPSPVGTTCSGFEEGRFCITRYQKGCYRSRDTLEVYHANSRA